MRPTLLTLIAAASLAASMAAGSTAAAGAGSDVPRVVVRFDDLDLTRRTDVERLYARMRFAVETLCPAPAGDVGRYVQGRACQREVLRRAVDRSGIPQLAELHRDREGAGRDRLARR